MLTIDLNVGVPKPLTASGVPPAVTPSGFNISTRDTESNILASSPTNPAGKATIAFGTDTYELYVWDGSAWSIYNND